MHLVIFIISLVPPTLRAAELLLKTPSKNDEHLVHECKLIFMNVFHHYFGQNVKGGEMAPSGGRLIRWLPRQQVQHTFHIWLRCLMQNQEHPVRFTCSFVCFIWSIYLFKVVLCLLVQPCWWIDAFLTTSYLLRNIRLQAADPDTACTFTGSMCSFGKRLYRLAAPPIGDQHIQLPKIFSVFPQQVAAVYQPRVNNRDYQPLTFLTFMSFVI